MPTNEEWEELKTECTWTQTSLNGVSGKLVTGPSGSSIFLCFTGSMYNNSVDTFSRGYYWSSSLKTAFGAYCTWFDFSDRVYGSTVLDRCYGHAVRAVLE